MQNSFGNAIIPVAHIEETLTTVFAARGARDDMMATIATCVAETVRYRVKRFQQLNDVLLEERK